MTEQPNQRPDGTGSSDATPPFVPPSFVPPSFVPPEGGEIPPPPLYNQSQSGLFGQDPYYQPPPLYNQDQYGQGLHPGQAGTPNGQEQYGQPAPYGQQGSYGQSAPYGQQAPYGHAAYYGMVPQPKGLSIASLVCGIVSVMLGFIMIPQIAAVITGHLGLRREPAGKGLAITGLVLGYLCLLGYGLFWLLALIGLTIASTTYGY